MSKVTELKADMVPATVPTPPIPDNLGRKIPSLHCHIQPIMPLVFDDSMTFYECLAKCTAYVNAIGEQINGLTDGVKEFLEYMVKWGEELDAQWVQYQADLNKAWADYQAVINGQITDLENRWQAYQTNLNQQWQTFKTQYLSEWNQYKTDFQQEWQDFKDSIETTIEGQVDAWLVDNMDLIVSKIGGWHVHDSSGIHITSSVSALSGGVLAHRIEWNEFLKAFHIMLAVFATNPSSSISQKYSYTVEFNDTFAGTINQANTCTLATSYYTTGNNSTIITTNSTFLTITPSSFKLSINAITAPMSNSGNASEYYANFIIRADLS